MDNEADNAPQTQPREWIGTRRSKVMVIPDYHTLDPTVWGRLDYRLTVPDRVCQTVDRHGIARDETGRVMPGNIPSGMVEKRKDYGFGGKYRAQCTAIKRNGERCKATPVKGTDRCTRHRGCNKARSVDEIDYRRRRRAPYKRVKMAMKVEAYSEIHKAGVRFARTRAYLCAVDQKRHWLYLAALARAWIEASNGKPRQWQDMCRELLK